MNLSLCVPCTTKTTTAVDTKQLAAIMTVAKMGRSVTVKITSSFEDGAGVIISRHDDTYTVLTAACVVDYMGAEFMIHTNQGNDYAVTNVIRVPQCGNKANHVAFVQFVSYDVYPVASLGNSDDALIGTDVYIPRCSQAAYAEKQEFELIKGSIIDCSGDECRRYSAANWSGMRGTPIFNGSAQVVGIHLATEVASRSSVTKLQVGQDQIVDICCF